MNKVGEVADKGIAAVDSKVDPALQNGMNKFNDSKVGQGLATVNKGAQKFADATNKFTDNAGKKTGGFMAGVEKTTSVLNDFNSAKKEGDAFGLSSEKIANGIKGKGKTDAQLAENDKEKTKEADSEHKNVKDSKESSEKEDSGKAKVKKGDTKDTSENTNQKAKEEEEQKRDNRTQLERLQAQRREALRKYDEVKAKLDLAQSSYKMYTESAERAEKYAKEHGERIGELQKELNALCAKYNVDSSVSQLRTNILLDHDYEKNPNQASAYLAASQAMSHVPTEANIQMSQICTDIHLASSLFEHSMKQWKEGEKFAQENDVKVQQLTPEVEAAHEALKAAEKALADFENAEATKSGTV